ncbi:MAG: hypothetical protein WAV76_17010, partial [Bacteroidota bacterium]
TAEPQKWMAFSSINKFGVQMNMNTIRVTSLGESTARNCRRGIKDSGFYKTAFWMLGFMICLCCQQLFAQGIGISETSITPDGSAILELRSTSRGLLLPRNTASLGYTVEGLLFYNTNTHLLNYYNGTAWTPINTNLSLYAPLASPTFTGTVIIPTPFTLGATSVTSTGTQINYLSAATGTTGTTSTNLVFSTSPTLVTPTLGAATATSINNVAITSPASLSTLTLASGKTFTANNTLTLSGTDGSTLNIGTGGTLGTGAYATIANYALLASPTFTGTVTIPSPFTLGSTSVTSTGIQLNYLNAATGTTGTTTTNLVFSTSPTLTTPNIGAATGTSLSVIGALTAQSTTNQLVLGTTNTTTISSTAPSASRVYTIPDFGANGEIPIGTAGNTISLTTTGATNVTLPTSGTLATTGVLIDIKTLTTASTSPYTPTSGTKSILVYIVGAGGQGGGCPATTGSAAAGGGAGGCAIKAIIWDGVSTFAFAVGNVGTAAGNGATGVAGNNSTFTNGATTITANGGGGGTLGNGTTGLPVAGGAGGTATNGDINIQGNSGGAGVRLAATTFYGLTGNGGSSIFGSGGVGAVGASGNGGAATGYGAGGGGAVGNATHAGGVGTAGVIIIYEHK